MSALLNDREGRLWAGTNDGIWEIRSGVPEKIVAYPSVIRTFADGADGGLLFSDGTEIKVLTAKGQIKAYPERVDGKPLRAWAILKDRQGNLSVWNAGARSCSRSRRTSRPIHDS